jgi:hypothetical protein
MPPSTQAAAGISARNAHALDGLGGGRSKTVAVAASANIAAVCPLG